MKSALEIRDAIKSADSILQDLRWELIDAIDTFSNDDIEQINKIARFVGAKADEIILTTNDTMWKRKNQNEKF